MARKLSIQDALNTAERVMDHYRNAAMLMVSDAELDLAIEVLTPLVEFIRSQGKFFGSPVLWHYRNICDGLIELRANRMNERKTQRRGKKV